MKEPEHGGKIGSFRNEWRMRHVDIFAHPTDDKLVVTKGTPLYPATGNPIWTTEAKSLFTRYLGTHGQVYK